MSQILEPVRGDVRLEARVTTEIHELASAASSMLDAHLPVHRCDDVTSAKQLLQWVWERTMAELALPAVLAAPARIARLTELLTRVRRLESHVEDARVAESVELIRRIRRALSHLESAATPAQLLSLAAEEACTLGFDRVGVSTVDVTHWHLKAMVIDKDPHLAEEMLSASREQPPVLDLSVESDVVTTNRPMLVHGVQDSLRVARQLVSLSGCTSYGVAPLTSGGNVVGLLHGDSFYPRREVDGSDLAVLGLFAKGVSQALTRVSSLERLSAAAEPAASVQAGPLSAREIEVIEQMAAGRGNLAIAQELCISEGTVKTHITHILRKLEASNRAEAVAYWLRR